VRVWDTGQEKEWGKGVVVWSGKLACIGEGTGTVSLLLGDLIAGRWGKGGSAGGRSRGRKGRLR